MSSKPSRGRLAIGLAMAGFVLALATVPARADLVPSLDAPPALTDAEQQILVDNPALGLLGAASPWLLLRALREIEAMGPGRREVDSLRIEPARLSNRDDLRILETNPALRDLWRTTPDAATALLSLIRAAAASAPAMSAR
jgi:hypothetical protein